MTVLSLRTRRPFLRACVARFSSCLWRLRIRPEFPSPGRRKAAQLALESASRWRAGFCATTPGRTAARIIAQVWAESFAEEEKAKAAPRRGCGSNSSTTAAAGRGPAHLHDRRHAPRDLLRALPLDRLHRAALHGWTHQGEATLGRSDTPLSRHRPTNLTSVSLIEIG